MPYIGNYHVTGDTASNFRLLDDISSFTQTFNGGTASIVDVSNDRIKLLEHRFVTGQRVTYGNGGGSDVGGLSNSGVYFVIKYDRDHIRLAASSANAFNNVVVPLSAAGSGTTHTLNVAFDGVNKVFRPTKDNGNFCRISRPAQLQISVNGVIQKPNPTPGTPVEGFKIDAGGNIEFASAPTNLETFWGQITAEALATFDIADNELDNFTGDGTTTDFTLSRTVPNNASVVVTINGVVQHATDNQGARAYSVYDTILSFTGAPSLGDEIQVRHIGFASPVNSDVTSFHGRVGTVTIVDSDPVVAIQSGGVGIGTVRTINFVGAGNSIKQVGDTVEVTISGSGGGGGSGVIHKETFNVTTNQTVFNLSNSYNSGYVDVFVNGVRLSPSDFTETDSTTITLAEAAIPGDVVDVLIHSSVVQNTIIDSSIDNLTVNDSLTGQIGGGEETVGTGSASFLAEVISMPKVLSCGTTSTVQPKTGHDITFVKYEEVQITGDADLILGGTADFMINVYNLTV
jgi:hypothetical protein